MATVYGMLGQAAPAASQLVTAYTVPQNKHATARVLVCNRSTSTTFRIAVSPAGAAVSDSHYLAHGQTIAANDSVSSVAFTVGPSDVVRVYSTNGALSFSVTGIEDDNS